MTRSFKRFATLAGAAALAATALHAAPAAAQQAKYCNNALTANSFYKNVLPAQSGADVEYHGQFQNQDPQRRAMTATMLRIQKIGPFTILRPVERIELNSYEQKDVVIFAVHTSGQGGQGSPTPQTVGQTIRFTCTYR